MCPVGLAVARHPVMERTLRFFRNVLRYRPVDFLYAAVAQHFVQPYQRLARLGEEYRTADGPVDAVGDAEEHLPRFAVALLDEGFYHLFEARFARRVALHELSGPFVDGDEVVVLVEDVPGGESSRESIVCHISVLMRCRRPFSGGLSEAERERHQAGGTVHDRGALPAAHNDAEGGTLSPHRVQHYLPASAARATLRIVRDGGDGQSRYPVFRVGGQVAEKQHPFGAEARRKHFAFLVRGGDYPSARQPGGGPNAVAREGGIGALGRFAGLFDKEPLLRRCAVRQGVLPVRECVLFFHGLPCRRMFRHADRQR